MAIKQLFQIARVVNTLGLVHLFQIKAIGRVKAHSLTPFELRWRKSKEDKPKTSIGDGGLKSLICLPRLEITSIPINLIVSESNGFNKNQCGANSRKGGEESHATKQRFHRTTCVETAEQIGDGFDP